MHTSTLYDVTSSYFEGHHCPLAQYGQSRDHRSDRPQIVYGLLCMVLVGDRGMITAAPLRDDLVPLDHQPAGAADPDLGAGPGPLQLSLFDERDLAEISSPDFPGERLIVCPNRDLARERKREALLAATERAALRNGDGTLR
jgi:hypothetical protein